MLYKIGMFFWKKKDLKMIVSGGIQAEWFIIELSKLNIPLEQIKSQLLKYGIKDNNIPYLPVDIYVKLFNWAASYTQKKNLGLLLAQKIDFREFGVFGYILLNSSNMEELCINFQTYQSIFMTGIGYTFTHENNIFEVIANYPTDVSPFDYQVAEFSLALFNQFIKRKLLSQISPLQVSFRHKKTAGDYFYKDVFGIECLFEQPQNSIKFEAKIKDISFDNSDPKLKAIVKEYGNNLLTLKPQHHDIVSLVRIIIAHKIPNQDFTIESICEELNIHSRTLHRKLKQHNTSYKLIKDEVILELAKDALLNSNDSVAQIAQHLQFSESSAFIRYFKRIMKISPTQFRKNKTVIDSIYA